MSSDESGLVAGVHRQALVVSLALTAGVVVLAGGAATLVLIEALDPLLRPSLGVRLGVVILGAFLLGAARAAEGSVGRMSSGASQEAVARRWFTGVLVSQALREGVGLVGAVLMFVAGDLAAGGALAGVALALMVFRTPRRSELEERLRRARD